jgi:5-methylcytosine-specific restriction endonuclease McrA
MKRDLRILDIQENVQQLSDKVLIDQAVLIVGHERGVTILALRHLREIEVRRLFVDMGYSSMYECCIRHFKYSEGQTQRRLSSARLMTELPEIEKQIQSGVLNVTNLAKIQSFVKAEQAVSQALSKDDKLTLIAQCENKTTRQLEKELIERSHQPALLAEKFHKKSQLLSSHAAENPEYIKFEALLDPAQQELLQEFKNLYAHELQDSSNISVLSFLLDKAVQHKKKKIGLIPKAKVNAPLPSATKLEATPRKPAVRKAIKASTKKFVWQRAQGYCEYQDKKLNTKCSSQFALQIDHVKSIALGGTDEISNLQLLCRVHNTRRAIKTFGVHR